MNCYKQTCKALSNSHLNLKCMRCKYNCLWWTDRQDINNMSTPEYNCLWWTDGQDINNMSTPGGETFNCLTEDIFELLKSNDNYRSVQCQILNPFSLWQLNNKLQSELLLFNVKWSFFSAISWREQVTFISDDDVRFVLDQHAKLVLYSASSNITKTTVHR